MKKSIILLIAVTFVILFVVHFGYSAHSERAVYRSVVNAILKEVKSDPIPISKMNVFISRPLVCSVSMEEEDLPPKGLLESYKTANNASEPIYLSALEGVVPIISEEDTKKLYRANYIWSPNDRKAVWVSRVGFSKSYSEAIICLGGVDRHTWGVLYYLKRKDGEWKIENEYIASLFT